MTSVKVLLTFMFTQVGVIVLIASYMVGGAFVFQHIERDSLQEQAVTAQNVSIEESFSWLLIF